MLSAWRGFAMPRYRTSSDQTIRRPRVCLACHGQRLATLLETASAFCLYRFEAGGPVAEGSWAMPAEGLPALAPLLIRAGVALLVCGGATCCCLKHFTRHGLAVAPWIAGDVPAVLLALRENRLETLLAPGARPGRGLARGAGFGKHCLEMKES
jgi:hypothetical protein